jgi:poly(hydroxyalkanoate) granule-associated protein
MLKQAKAQVGAKQLEQAKQLSQAVLDSSRQIWLAGLGAFAKAQQEGAKTFDALVKQGEQIENRTRKVAKDKAGEVKAAAVQAQAKVTGTWDKLEQVFEDRVARALNRLGVYTAADVNKLAARVEELSQAVNGLVKQKAVKSVAKPAAKPVAHKAVKAKAGTAKGHKSATLQ